MLEIFCLNYDKIFIEDLSLLGMGILWGRKMSDLGYAEFVTKLEYVATRFGVIVHKIDRFNPGSMTCTCCHVNKEQGQVTNNILRQSIVEFQRGARPT